MSWCLFLVLTALSGGVSRGSVWIEVHGPLDASTQSHIRRGIAKAEETQSLLVLDIDTPGGGVEVTWQIARALRDAGDKGLDTVAWVNERATSAGAMLTLACQEVYMRSAGSIGSALPVTLGPGGMAPVSSDESVREKTFSYCRQEFRVVAEKNGRPGVLAEAMVDPDVGVLWVEALGEKQVLSRREYDDLGLDGETPRILRTIVEKGKLLNLNGPDAVELGLADGIVDSTEELARRAGFDEDRIELLPRTRSEDWASLLDVWSPLLLVLAFVLAFVEFKIPGFGIAGTASILCFTLVVLGRWLVGLADVPNVVLLVAGVLLIAGEIFLLPGTLWMGLLGVLAVLTGLVWSFAGAGTGFAYALDRSILLNESLRVLVTLSVALACAFAISRVLPKTPLLNRLVLDPSRSPLAKMDTQKQTPTEQDISGSAFSAKTPRARVGEHGSALTVLRPVGKVSLTDHELAQFEARANGPEIARGTAIIVVEVERSGRLLVEEARSGEDSLADTRGTAS